MSLVSELKRRKVFKVGAAYLVVAWLAIQAASIAFPAFEAPTWTVRVFILVAMLGFPLALVMAWVFDVTPEGVKLDPAGAGSKLFLVGAVALAALALAWYFKGQPSYRAGDVPGGDAPSVAVLPFVNMSSKPDEDYFSDGMTEELLNVLAKVPKLKVAARTSVFEFKGKGGDVKEIGRKLGVNHIVEGSVRRDGEQLRITAQLVRVADGFHLWSETYDRELKGVFALQEEIAGKVGQQLIASLGVAAAPAARAAIDPAAYDEYLRGRALLRQRRSIMQSIAHLEQAVKLAPEFAQGWATLSLAHEVLYWYTTPAERASLGSQLDNMKRTAARAQALAPDDAITLHALGNVARAETRYDDATRLYQRAMQADPGYSDAREDYCELLSDLGQYAEADPVTQELIKLDPMVLQYWLRVQILGWRTGRSEVAAEAGRRMREIDPNSRWGVTEPFMTALRRDNIPAARAALEQAQRSAPDVVASDVLMFHWATGDAGADDAAARALLRGNVEFSVYAALKGDSDAYFSGFEGELGKPVRYKAWAYLGSSMAYEMLQSPRGKQLLRDNGQLAYWRAHAWPPRCHALAGDDFECRKGDEGN